MRFKLNISHGVYRQKMSKNSSPGRTVVSYSYLKHTFSLKRLVVTPPFFLYNRFSQCRSSSLSQIAFLPRLLFNCWTKGGCSSWSCHLTDTELFCFRSSLNTSLLFWTFQSPCVELTQSAGGESERIYTCYAVRKLVLEMLMNSNNPSNAM